MGIREGDIESIRRGMKDKGRSVKSNVIVEKNGTKVYYDVNKKGRVKITNKDN